VDDHLVLLPLLMDIGVKVHLKLTQLAQVEWRVVVEEFIEYLVDAEVTQGLDVLRPLRIRKIRLLEMLIVPNQKLELLVSCNFVIFHLLEMIIFLARACEDRVIVHKDLWFDFLVQAISEAAGISEAVCILVAGLHPLNLDDFVVSMHRWLKKVRAVVVDQYFRSVQVHAI
jgi:hypothetical protein